MPNALTVTAKTGPAKQATATVISSVVGINYDLQRQVVAVTTSDSNQTKEFDLTGVTTLTISLSSSVYTLALS